ncbi:MAG: DUF1848 domain-containing protein [Clostridia bacterium]|nr:DUF1848 domain-containing protein [Clostridia bacterium]
MIISASRRTDIPAFYSEWFMNRVRDGYCLVANPFNAKQVSRISLCPDRVDAIVFWSKNPAPLIPRLTELDSMGFRYYFQYTICDYPVELEPDVPPLADRTATALELAKRVGPRRVIWRYDPIIISDHTDVEHHKRAFARIASALHGATTRVVVSLVDYYGKVDRNLRPLERSGWHFQKYSGAEPESRDLLRWIQEEAHRHGFETQSCAEAVNMSDLGIPHGKCIDDELLNELWGIPLSRKDPGQRGECLCAASKDIGANNTCLHGCRYCYATMSLAVAQEQNREHDPASPSLVGHAVVAEHCEPEIRQSLF